MRVRKHGVARVACLSRINTITPHGSLLPYMQMRETGGPTTGLLFLHVHRPSSAAGDAFQFPLRGAEDDPP